MPKISKTSKMKITGKKVGSWSLPAGPSCPGSKNSDGSIAEICQGCYAKKGMYRFPVVKDARAYNREDYHKDDWVDRMVKQVSKFDYFRWFDSGDIETPELASKIAVVITRTPNVNHWVPTRSDKVHEIAKRGLIKFRSSVGFANAAIRLSADNIGLSKPERPGVNSYVINVSDIPEANKRGILVCPATTPGTTQKSCDTCTACYSDVPVAYVLH